MGSRLALVLVGVALLLPVPASGQTRPILRIVNDSPLTLRGTGFKARERVQVTVVMRERILSRQLRTGSLGGFTIRFVGVGINYCVFPLSIRARGSSSGLARTLMPIADCAMP